jgi:hypothetical protein
MTFDFQIKYIGEIIMVKNIWEEFDKKIDTEGLKKDVADAVDNKREFSEVPVGTYEVKIVKMNLQLNKKGNPMVCIWFKILDGNYKNQNIFMYQVISQGFQINIVNELLCSLETDIEVVWDNYTKYNEMLLEIAEWLDINPLEYELEYGKTEKGFNKFKITNVFD